MGQLKLTTASGGSVILNPTNTASDYTISVPAVTDTMTTTTTKIISGTAVTASGSSVDFTGIPSWVKRITVMFSGVSTDGTSNPIIQLGSGSVTTSGYTSASSTISTTVSTTTYTNGFGIPSASASAVFQGSVFISLISGNTWIASGVICRTDSTGLTFTVGGSIALSGALDRVRITTAGGTNTFDAGSINILYE